MSAREIGEMEMERSEKGIAHAFGGARSFFALPSPRSKGQKSAAPLLEHEVEISQEPSMIALLSTITTYLSGVRQRSLLVGAKVDRRALPRTEDGTERRVRNVLAIYPIHWAVPGLAPAPA